MSNPKPVEGARKLLARWRKDICDSQEEYNFLQRCADELEAALSAAPARDGVLRCHACGQDVTGEGYRPHRYVICHKPGCADKHVINGELLDKAICAEAAAKEQAEGGTK